MPKARQLQIWEYEDTPLFSGVAMRVKAQVFNPGLSVIQEALPAECKFCQDTGRIGDKYCWCEAGVKARKR